MGQSTEAVKLNPKFKPLYLSDKRYFILTGGRGSGKSFTVYDYLVRLTYEKGHGILFTRYTMTSAQKTIIPLFTKTISALGVAADFHITQEKVINKRTGSFLYFSGIKTSSGDQTANLKSLPNIDTWVIEEGEDYNDEASFIDIDDSIRTSQTQNRVIWIQNPSYAPESIIYKRFFEGYEQTATIEALGVKWDYETTSHPDVEHIHTTYHDNREYLDEDKVAQWDAIAIKNPDFYRHKYIGGWIKDKEGAIFQKSELDYFALEDLNMHNAEAVVSFIDVADRGTDSLSMPIGVLIKDELFIVDWYFTQENQDITAPEIGYMCKRWGIEHLAVEINGVGKGFYENLTTYVGCQTYEISQQANKHSRILQNSGFVRNYLRFRNDYEAGSHYDEAMRELYAYNRDDKQNRKGGLNDDAPDGITGLWLVLNDLFSGRWL
ncbi:phage terminase large subunit [Leeuwenhoekiella aequorea]|uniref:phage terminase large subunit n=1 Tax=Leeuwenhoekiella aequorea TaxID=283736 RepID=UPI00352E194B|tara:strand:+ start:14764 stop:16068 length:1305 start_codon:yes stop_codon:yes gene_type:complete